MIWVQIFQAEPFGFDKKMIVLRDCVSSSQKAKYMFSDTESEIKLSSKRIDKDVSIVMKYAEKRKQFVEETLKRRGEVTWESILNDYCGNGNGDYHGEFEFSLSSGLAFDAHWNEVSKILSEKTGLYVHGKPCYDFDTDKSGGVGPLNMVFRVKKPIRYTIQ
jgi:hypothetical protein